jgi:RNA polymerase sigma-70 factor (ECF subfamily)
MTGDRGAAEDLVQDVFVRMLRYRSTYRDDGRFETWMFRIARNARADHFRKHGGAVHVPDDEMDWASPEPGPAHLLERARDMARLKRALQALREDRRELIVMVRYQGMTHEQVGAVLGVDAGTVKVRFHRALKELRDAFTRVPEGE